MVWAVFVGKVALRREGRAAWWSSQHKHTKGEMWGVLRKPHRK